MRRSLLPLLVVVGSLLAPPAASTEFILLPFSERTDLAAVFVGARIHAFTTTIRWASTPERTYADVLEEASFIYHYYRTVLHFSEDEITSMREADRKANPGTVAYIVSRDPGTGRIRGAMRIAATEPMPGGEFPWLTAPFFGRSELPLEKTPGVGAKLNERYPKRVELGRFASDDPSRIRRIFIFLQMVRAGLVFLGHALGDGTVVAESTEVTRELYATMGMRVVPDIPLLQDRFLMVATVREGVDFLLRPVEYSTVIEHLDPYSDAAAERVLHQLATDPNPQPAVLQRMFGAATYHRALARARLGDFDGALADAALLRRFYGDEPEVLVLELELLSRSLVDFWRGEGDVPSLVTRLLDPAAVERFRTDRTLGFDAEAERLHWLALAFLVAEDGAQARALREETARRLFPMSRDPLLAVELRGAARAEPFAAASTGEEARRLLPLARYHYRSIPVALTTHYNLACARLLRVAGDPLAPRFEARAALLSP